MNSTKLLLEFKSQYKTVKAFVKEQKRHANEILKNRQNLNNRDQMVLLDALEMLNNTTTWDDVTEYIIQFVI